MAKLNRLTYTIVLFLALCTSSLAETTQSDEAKALIEELGLRAAATPVTNDPDWRPEKIAVLLLPLPGIAGD